MQWASHNLRHCLAASVSFPGKANAVEMYHGDTHKMQTVGVYWIFLERDILVQLVFSMGCVYVVSAKAVHSQHTYWLMQFSLKLWLTWRCLYCCDVICWQEPGWRGWWAMVLHRRGRCPLGVLCNSHVLTLTILHHKMIKRTCQQTWENI